MSTCPVLSTEHIIIGTYANFNIGALKLELHQSAFKTTVQLED